MSYGIKTPQFNSMNDNETMIIHTAMNTDKVAYGVSDTLRNRRFQIVHSTRGIGKIYNARDTSMYVCKNNINSYIAGAVRTYYSTDPMSRYDENIAINRNMNYGLEVKGKSLRLSFTTRNYYIRIIDQVFFRNLDGLGIVTCNLKFNYVSKIGVALPSTIYGDTRDEYFDNYMQQFHIFDNVLQSTFGNNNSGAEIKLTRPYEMFDRQINNGEAIFGSPAYIFDLTGL